MHCVNGKYYAELYCNKLSGYHGWCAEDLGAGFYFNAANIGPYMSLDETCLSNGEVRTFLTNKDGHGGKGTLAAAIPGTKSGEIISTLMAAMGKHIRRRVKEVTCDLSSSMMLIATEVFYNAYVVNDRFHVQQLYPFRHQDIQESCSYDPELLSPLCNQRISRGIQLISQNLQGTNVRSTRP